MLLTEVHFAAVCLARRPNKKPRDKFRSLRSVKQFPLDNSSIVS